MRICLYTAFLATIFALTGHLSVQAQTLSPEANLAVIEALQVEFGDLMPHFYALAQCESSLNQKATHLNKNGTTDYGLLQNNSIYLKDAADLGLDFVNSMDDNIRYARLTFEKQGFGAWLVCSKKLGLLP